MSGGTPGPSGKSDPSGTDSEEGAGKEGSPAGEARVDGAGAEESGYRRDDYWRQQERDSAAPDEVPEPEQGYAFESPEEKARSGDDDESKRDGDG